MGKFGNWRKSSRIGGKVRELKGKFRNRRKISGTIRKVWEMKK